MHCWQSFSIFFFFFFFVKEVDKADKTGLTFYYDGCWTTIAREVFFADDLEAQAVGGYHLMVSLF